MSTPIPLTDLPSLQSLHRICNHAVGQATDEIQAIEFATARLQQRQIQASPEQIAATIRHYISAQIDGSLEIELEHELFMLEQVADEQRHQFEFGQYYSELVEASPGETAGISAGEFLRTIYPPGTSLVVCESPLGKYAKIWDQTTPDQKAASSTWFWPFPVKIPEAKRVADGGVGFKFNPTLVKYWTNAVMVFPAESMLALAPLIIAGLLPVRSIVVTPELKASVLFRVTAKDRGEWLLQCREIKAAVSSAGVKKIGNFRVDWVGHLPRPIPFGNRLVYVATNDEAAVMPPNVQ